MPAAAPAEDVRSRPTRTPKMHTLTPKILTLTVSLTSEMHAHRLQPRLRFGVAFYELTAESAAGSTGDTFVRTERGVWSVRKPRAWSGARTVLTMVL